MTNLRKTYTSIKPAVDERLEAFSALWKRGSDVELFQEMCFCTCTPQTNAHRGWTAACVLAEKNLLDRGSVQQVAAVLRASGVRFHNHKAGYIVQNRKTFYPDTKTRISEILADDNPQEILCRRVSGWGMKEAAHFLRNIGFGDIACILDRHILRQLERYGVIPAIPKTLSKTVYREIDGAMKTFAKDCNIPLAALDLIFWYEETGELFK
jgi:N-glycosylase/DNA lyase